jgi:hypothetical protein
MALDRERRDALVRVTCEAVSNAAGTATPEPSVSSCTTRAGLCWWCEMTGSASTANLDDNAVEVGIEGMRERIEVWAARSGSPRSEDSVPASR